MAAGAFHHRLGAADGNQVRVAAIVWAVVVGLAGCDRSPPSAPPTATPEALHAHDAEFRQEVISLADGVHVAVGYGIANAILVEGDDGAVVVDTLESLSAAERVMAEFRERTDKPVVAIIYTHSHPDHVQGAAAFVPAGTQVPIYAHVDVAPNMDRVASELQPVITRRSLRMYGSLLPEEERSNIGIGSHLALEDGAAISILRPTVTFEDRLAVTLAGRRFELVHAPGETEDQIFVWLPDSGILMPGDNLYKAFPNLYTLRGTRFRDPKLWADSLDRMRRLQPRVLVPSHGRPLTDPEQIAAVMTDYRDAIRYVHDQTLRRMNAGQTAEEIAATLALPPHLAASPYLQTFYGKPGWSARSLFQGQLGWYSGDPAELAPLAPDEQARRWVELAGGVEAVRQQAEAALAAGDLQWALELSSPLRRVAPDDPGVRQVRVAALRGLAAREANPNARHWYLTHAREVAGELVVPSRIVTPTPDMLAAMPLSTFFDGLVVNLDAEAAGEVEQALVFEFTDGEEAVTVRVRRGVAEVAAGVDDEAAIHVRVPAQVFKEMLAQLRSPAVTLVRDFELVRGGRLELLNFMRLFVPVEVEAGS